MGEPRSAEQISYHYAIERDLANRLRTASREARRDLYTAVYEELFARVKDHPQLTKRVSTADRAQQVDAQLSFLRKYLHPDTTFLEIGAGDAALSLAVARIVRSAVAVDVTRLLPESMGYPANFRLHISMATDLGVGDGTISLAYSNQLMEHLHPDDAFEQLRNVVAALALGGTYVCVTPNRLTGPHDISRAFDPVATGLHLKEYSGAEIERIFMTAGFSRIAWHAGLRGRFYRIPMWVLRITETLVEHMPRNVRRHLANRFPVRNALNGIVVATR